MSLYTIGDLHLSLGTDKPMDKFSGWDNYVSRLENNWNRLVTSEDTVIVPGDISWAMTLQMAVKDFEFINSLNGRKIIMRGNHDYWWETMNKLRLFKQKNHLDSIDFLFNNAYRIGDITVCGTRGWFYDAETENVEKVLAREAGRLKISIEQGIALGGEIVAFLHYPPVSPDKKCDEILSVLREFNIKRCYFGHLHNEKNGKYADFEFEGIRFSLVSADFLSFMPKAVFG